LVIFVLFGLLSIETASFAKCSLLLAENRHRAGQRASIPIAAVHDLTGLRAAPAAVVALLAAACHDKCAERRSLR